MLTSEDRRNIRTGAMRATGQRHASLIFWASVAPYLLSAAAIVAAVLGVVWLYRAKVDPWLQGDAGPIKLAVIVVGVVCVALFLRSLFRPRYGRRGNR